MIVEIYVGTTNKNKKFKKGTEI